jgi:hypothetical protein
MNKKKIVWGIKKRKRQSKSKREREMDEEEKTGFCRRFHCKWMNAERQLNSEEKNLQSLQ